LNDEAHREKNAERADVRRHVIILRDPETWEPKARCRACSHPVGHVVHLKTHLEDWPFFRPFMFWRLTTFEVLPELVDNKWDLLVAGIACNSFCLPGLWGRLKVAGRNFPFCVLLYSRFTGFEVCLESL
jgi:hypothetical protein